MTEVVNPQYAKTREEANERWHYFSITLRDDLMGFEKTISTVGQDYTQAIDGAYEVMGRRGYLRSNLTVTRVERGKEAGAETH